MGDLFNSIEHQSHTVSFTFFMFSFEPITICILIDSSAFSLILLPLSHVDITIFIEIHSKALKISILMLAFISMPLFLLADDELGGGSIVAFMDDEAIGDIFICEELFGIIEFRFPFHYFNVKQFHIVQKQLKLMLFLEVHDHRFEDSIGYKSGAFQWDVGHWVFVIALGKPFSDALRIECVAIHGDDWIVHQRLRDRTQILIRYAY